MSRSQSASNAALNAPTDVLIPGKVNRLPPMDTQVALSASSLESSDSLRSMQVHSAPENTSRCRSNSLPPLEFSVNNLEANNCLDPRIRSSLHKDQIAIDITSSLNSIEDNEDEQEETLLL